jgi:stage II sporulation protein D
MLPVIFALLLFSSCARTPKRGEVAITVEPTVRVALLTGATEAAIGAGGAVTLRDVNGEGQTWPDGGSVRISLSGSTISITGPDGVARHANGNWVELSSSTGVILLKERKYRGALRVRKEGGGTLAVINRVKLESYLRSVVKSEIGALSEGRMEAMKAQAIASRSYTLYKMAQSNESSYDVVSGVGDQVYSGVAGERPITDRAVAETYGMVVTYGGEPIRANFSSTCGGVTVDNNEAWPGEEVLPYLRSVRDVGGRRGAEFCEDSKYHRWREEWELEEMASILALHYSEGASEGASGSGKFSGRIKSIKVTKRNSAGRARVVEVKTEEGEFEVRADRMRWALRRPDGGPLRSTFFDLKLEKRRGEAKGLIAEGRGWGHGVGMCQWGAIGMADGGHSYQDILNHYYKDVDIERLYGHPA